MSTDLPPEREDEEVILLIKKHWYLILWPLIKVFIGLVLVLIVLRIWGASIYFTATFFAWAIISFVYLFMTIYVWAKTCYIITNERVIRREQKSFFSKKISEIDLENIHNVTSEITGPVQSAFGFGDVLIQSFGVSEAVKLTDIPNPTKIQTKISEILRAFNLSLEKESEPEKEEEKKEKERVEEEKVDKGPEKYVPRKPHIEEE